MICLVHRSRNVKVDGKKIVRCNRVGNEILHFSRILNLQRNSVIFFNSICHFSKQSLNEIHSWVFCSPGNPVILISNLDFPIERLWKLIRLTPWPNGTQVKANWRKFCYFRRLAYTVCPSLCIDLRQHASRLAFPSQERLRLRKRKIVPTCEDLRSVWPEIWGRMGVSSENCCKNTISKWPRLGQSFVVILWFRAC